jgi:hypothetical protein
MKPCTLNPNLGARLALACPCFSAINEASMENTASLPAWPHYGRGLLRPSFSAIRRCAGAAFVRVVLAGCVLAGSLSAKAQDKLIVPDGSAPSGESLLLPLSIAGPSPVVAMQFDVRFTKSIVDVLGPITAGDSNHRVMSREVGEGLRRVVVFSRSNALLPKDVVIDLPMLMAGTAPGTPSPMLRIEGLCFALENGTKITPAIQRGPIDSWFASNFTPAELQVPSIYGDDRDPDGDGLPNIVEFGVGGSPFTWDAPLLPAVTTETGPGGEDLWRMTYRKSKMANGVVVEPQISGNLVDWTALTATPTGAEDAVSIEFKAAVDRAASPRKFMRLNVRRSE